jgi:catechol 2,3-dioxygenase-like lactoylglutathione lyase family enzyme
VALHVRDVAATVEFYRAFAGLHVVHDRVDGDVRVVWLSERAEEPDFVIVALGFAPTPEAQPSHLAHFGYDLPSRAAVDEIAARGERAGLLVQGPLDAGPIVGYYCMLRDPDGNLVEFSHGQPIDPRRIKTT